MATNDNNITYIKQNDTTSMWNTLSSSTSTSSSDFYTYYIPRYEIRHETQYDRERRIMEEELQKREQRLQELKLNWDLQQVEYDHRGNFLMREWNHRKKRKKEFLTDEDLMI